MRRAAISYVRCPASSWKHLTRCNAAVSLRGAHVSVPCDSIGVCLPAMPIRQGLWQAGDLSYGQLLPVHRAPVDEVRTRGARVSRCDHPAAHVIIREGTMEMLYPKYPPVNHPRGGIFEIGRAHV